MDPPFGTCALCRRFTLLQYRICRDCERALDALSYRNRVNRWCTQCGAPLLHEDAVCIHDTPSDSVIRLMPHRGVAKRLVMRYRNQRNRMLVHVLHHLLHPTLEMFPSALIISVPHGGWGHLEYLAKLCMDDCFSCSSQKFQPRESVRYLQEVVVVLEDVFSDDSQVISCIQRVKERSDARVIGLCITSIDNT